MRFTRDEVAASVAAEPTTASERTIAAKRTNASQAPVAASKKRAAAQPATPPARQPATIRFAASELIWALGSLCGLHQRNFSAEMLVHEFPPETLETSFPPETLEAADSAAPSYSESTLLHAGQRLGFRVKRIAARVKDLAGLPLPLLVQISAPAAVAMAAGATVAAEKDSAPVSATVAPPPLAHLAPAGPRHCG